ncbi:uncharacterized protein LOC119732676 [Patiria miniata]|uniref:G-protein coupled receptors family 1 profile domain-containing protein n=1 Tax=Patiria miniata TaxID=46514 RepID=A0A914AET9_PATMI|nr:uncharacterized protein LOC119732676 [Patiria miniata]
MANLNVTSEDVGIDGPAAGASLAVISAVSLAVNLTLLVIIGKRQSGILKTAERLLTLYCCLEATYAAVPALLSSVSYLGQWRVNANEVICDFHGWAACAAKCSCAFITTVLLLSCYLEQRQSLVYRTQMRLFYAAVFGVVVVCLIAAVPIMGGLKMASFEPSGSYCHFDYRQTIGFLRGFCISLVLAGYILLQTTLFCCVSILCDRRRNTGRDLERGIRKSSHGFNPETRGRKSLASRSQQRRGGLNDGNGVVPRNLRQQDKGSQESETFTTTVLVMVTVLWLCFLPFLIVVVLAQTGIPILSRVDFAVVRVLSVEGALNPILILVTFPPYRQRALEILTLPTRGCVGRRSRNQRHGLYVPDSKRIGLSESVVYDDSTLLDSKAWYLVKPNRSFARSYSTGDLTSHVTGHGITGGLHPHGARDTRYQSSLRSILQPSKSSEMLSQSQEKRRRSIHWEDGVNMGREVTHRSKVILVQQGPDKAKTGLDSVCYIDDEEASYSSETGSSYSDECTSESDHAADYHCSKSAPPVYIINGRAYYTPATSIQGTIYCQCEQCERRMEHQTNADRDPSSLGEGKGMLATTRVYGRAEQRAGTAPYESSTITTDGQEVSSPKSKKPRVLRKQVERLRRIRQHEIETSQHKGLIVRALDENAPGYYQEILTDLQDLPNKNQTTHTDYPYNEELDRDTLQNYGESCNEHDIRDDVHRIPNQQYEDQRRSATNRQEQSSYNINVGAVQQVNDDDLNNRIKVQKQFRNVLTVNEFPEMIAQTDVDQATTSLHLPRDGHNSPSNIMDSQANHERFNPSWSIRPLNVETRQDDPQLSVTSEHLGRGMESLKHLEMHCEHLLERSLSFRNNPENESSTAGQAVISKELAQAKTSPMQLPTEESVPNKIFGINTAERMQEVQQLTDTMIPQEVLGRGTMQVTNERQEIRQESIPSEVWMTSKTQMPHKMQSDLPMTSEVRVPHEIPRTKTEQETSQVQQTTDQTLMFNDVKVTGEAKMQYTVLENNKVEVQNTEQATLLEMPPEVLSGTRVNHKRQKPSEVATSSETQMISQQIQMHAACDQTAHMKLDESPGVCNSSNTLKISSQDARAEQSYQSRVGEDIDKPSSLMGQATMVNNVPMEKDIVFHGLKSEDPQVINILFQKVIMKPENQGREVPLGEVNVVRRPGDAKVDEIRQESHTILHIDTISRRQEQEISKGDEQPIKNQTTLEQGQQRQGDQNNSQGQNGEDLPTSHDIPYRHFLRSINGTPTKNEQHAIPSIHVTPSDSNDVVWASESDDSVESDSSVESLFCKPPMLKLGSKRRKGKNNLMIPYWLNTQSHTTDTCFSEMGSHSDIRSAINNDGSNRSSDTTGHENAHRQSAVEGQLDSTEILTNNQMDAGISVRYFEIKEPPKSNEKLQLLQQEAQSNGHMNTNEHMNITQQVSKSDNETTLQINTKQEISQGKTVGCDANPNSLRQGIKSTSKNFKQDNMNNNTLNSSQNETIGVSLQTPTCSQGRRRSQSIDSATIIEGFTSKGLRGVGGSDCNEDFQDTPIKMATRRASLPQLMLRGNPKKVYIKSEIL